MSFNQFRLSSDILKGLKDLKIESPSPIQKKIYKAVENGSDLVINTNTDQKPELGYLLSLLNKISKSDRRQGTRAILLAADPERAKQIDEWVWAVGYHAQIESACLLPGDKSNEHKASLAAGPVIVISTPAHLASILAEGRMVFREVDLLIVDQADLVEDWDAVESISTRIMSKCQNIFTASKDSKELRAAEEKLLTDPKLIKLEKTPSKKKKEEQPEAIPKDLTQYYINVPPRSKISTLMAHLDQNKTDTVVIFAASRRTADRLFKILRKSGRRAVSIHDKVDKKAFDERFEKFTKGDVQHLIIGELSAADIPLEHATQVINYDVPEDVNEYKLRADLVGSGQATRILSLVSKQDRGDIRSICSSLGYAPEEVPLPKTVKEKTKSSKPSKKSGKSQKKKSRSKSRPKKQKKESKPEGISGLPRPTYDQLSGGRTGKKKEKEESGIVGFFKKLFS